MREPTPTTERERWELRYAELRAVHEVFCVGIRKALGISCPVSLSTILEVAIAMKASSDENWRAKYGHIQTRAFKQEETK